MKILLLYTTYNKQTFKIIHQIYSRIPHNMQVDIIELCNQSKIDLNSYEAIIIGTSIRYGFYNKLIKNFINQNSCRLNEMIGGFFGVNLVARKSNKNTPETNIYTKKFLLQIKWKPSIKAVFAGALHYPKYNFLDRNIIRFIMWLGKGDTDVTRPFIEYTDWSKVEQFSDNFVSLLLNK